MYHQQLHEEVAPLVEGRVPVARGQHFVVYVPVQHEVLHDALP